MIPSSLIAPVAARASEPFSWASSTIGDDLGVLVLVEGLALALGLRARRTWVMTPAICLGPITAILAVGHRNVKRLPKARPDIP